jgi:two-component system NtrC family sensor kinase
VDDPSRVSGTPQAVPNIVVRAHKLDAVGRLVPGVIHELNNPLSAIVGFGELLRTDPRLPADMREHAELLVRETARTQRLIQAILEFLRTRPAERMPTSIRALVDAVLLLHGYRLLSSSIQVEQDVPADLPQVELDRSSMQLVLVDLVQEAIDAALAAGGSGHLRVEAAQAGERGRETVAITVAWSVSAAAGDQDALEAPDVDRETARRVAAAIVEAWGSRRTTAM